ncbi:MAG: carbohydrate ABC transporter permease, partial [Rhodobacterales bacterium]
MRNRHSFVFYPLVAYAIVVIAPFLWIAGTAFKRQIDILQGKIIFTPVLSNFRQLFDSREATFLNDLYNSSVIAVSSTALVLVIATAAAFTLQRLSMPKWFINVIFLWVLIFYMLPPITFIGAWFIMADYIGLFNTRFAVILGHTTINLPLGLWLMATFINEIPKELLEAARVDGCNNRQIFSKVIVPLVKPGLISTGVIVFIFSWNDFLVALTLTTKATQTVPVSIATFAQEYEIRYGAMAAGSFISTIPALVLLLIGQKYIVKGLLAGAV